MPTHGEATAGEPRLLVALMVARAGQIALLLGGPERWCEASGYTLVPAELPGGQVATDASPADAVSKIALRALGGPGHVVPSATLYGRSTRHTIDRLIVPPGDETPLPLLRLERLAPRETADGCKVGDARAVQTVHLSVYRTSLAGLASPGPELTGILWLAPAALRQALRGIPLADLVALSGVTLERAPGTALPEDAFVFVPGDYGERYLLRIAAKYGRAALFQDTVG